MRVDWCVSSWFRIKNTHSLTTGSTRAVLPSLPCCLFFFFLFRLDTGANWRVLALSQAHHRSRLSDSAKNGNALSSVHNAALPAR